MYWAVFSAYADLAHSHTLAGHLYAQVFMRTLDYVALYARISLLHQTPDIWIKTCQK